MGYVDEVAQDGKGGWLDMGTDDLCFFLINHTGLDNGVGMPVSVPPFPEKSYFSGIPFNLTAPKKNNGKAMISLRSKNRALKLPASAKNIAVNKKADTFSFIHAANYVPSQRGVTIANYILKYEDGTSATLPVRSWIEIGDWFAPKKIEQGRICWTGSNRTAPVVGVYLTTWDNPHPNKVVKSIDIIGALTNAQIGVIGITGSREVKEGGQEARAHWDFTQFDNGVVEDSAGMCLVELRGSDQETPQVVQVSGEKALLFDGASHFSNDITNLEAFDQAKPFTIKMGISLDALPVAHNKLYGLFENMHYGKKGFRSLVDRKGRVGVALFYENQRPKYIRGKTEMEIGRFYNVEVSFDNDMARLFINGKLDSMIKAGLPTPRKEGHFNIGKGSGMGVFKGKIQYASIYQ